MKHVYAKLKSSVFIVAVIVFVTACSQPRSDEEIRSSIDDALRDSPGLSGVEVAVQEGVVTLSGTCEGENCADSAETKVKEVEGVSSVTNNIQDQAKTDLTLRTSVQSIISKYEGVQADVAAGVIVLRGSINRDQVQPLMNELQALNAKQIDNQLAVN